MMTSSNPPKESPHTEALDEELDKVALELYQHGKNEVRLQIYLPYAKDKLESLIESTVLSVIGEDEQLVGDLENSVKALFDITDMPRLVRNTLRAEQRSKLGRLLNKGEE